MGFLAKILGVDLENVDPRMVPSESKFELSGEESLEVRIEMVLESIRPALHADGGDIELVEVVGNSAKVRMTGACNGCPSAGLTLQFGIEAKLRDAISDFKDLIPT